jgi:hypothetical protein
LRNHVAQHHPGDLDVFEIGWKALGQALQERWHKKAQLLQPDEHLEDFRPDRWSSWARVSHQLSYPFASVYGSIDGTVQNVRQELQSLISERISHAGQLFEIPYMRDPNGEGRLCESISRCSAEAILEIEMNAVVTRWKGLMEEHGLEKVAEAYFAGSWEHKMMWFETR